MRLYINAHDSVLFIKHGFNVCIFCSYQTIKFCWQNKEKSFGVFELPPFLSLYHSTLRAKKPISKKQIPLPYEPIDPGSYQMQVLLMTCLLELMKGRLLHSFVPPGKVQTTWSEPKYVVFASTVVFLFPNNLTVR